MSASSWDTSRSAAARAIGLGVANDHMGAQAVHERAVVALGGERGHLGDGVGHRCDRVRPGEEHVGLGGGDILGGRGETTEVHRGTGAADGRRPWWVQGEVDEVAVHVDRLAVQQLTQRLHPLAGALVPGRRFEFLTGDVGRDDVDAQSTIGELIDGGELAGELRQPHLAHPHGEQQVDLLGVGGARCGERGGVDAEGVPRRQQHVVEAVAIGGADDV